MNDPVIAQRIREFSEESILGEYACFRADSIPDACPARDAEGTREVARLGLPLDWLFLGFRVGHRCHWEAWSDLVETRVHDPARRRELLERGSGFFFDYVERLTSLVAEEYERERQRNLRDDGERRGLLVYELLQGAEVDPESLGWPLDHNHLGVLAWAEGGDEAAREFGAMLGRPVMVIAAGVEGSWFAWVSGKRQLTDDDDRRIAEFRPNRGRLALGLEAAGAQGFRLTNRQARRAGWVAWYTDSPLTRFQDVALEALAIEDAESARAFVATELDGLDDDSTRSTRLRETLVAYFNADQNAAAAAASLGVHQQTVANRIRAVEELLGEQVPSRRAELDLALRLRRCFEKPPSLQAGLQNEGYLP
jgi:hypothetical protein